MGHPPMRLKFHRISGVEFEECYKSRIIDTLDDVEVNIIDLPHLKKTRNLPGGSKTWQIWKPTVISLSPAGRVPIGRGENQSEGKYITLES